MGYICILLFFSLVSVVTYTFFVDIFPELIKFFGCILSSLFMISGSVSLAFALMNYITLISTSPGVVPRPRSTDDKDLTSLTSRGGDGSGGGMKTCRVCRAQQPERACHCPICDCCVLKMDHHCPWINNCVGQLNQRYFLNFLLWLAIACSVVASTGGWMMSYGESVGDSDRVVLSLLLSGLIGLCLYGFCIWNWFLCLMNLTAMEVTDFIWRGKRSRHSRGMAHNMWMVFGTRNIFRAVLPSWKPLPSDGEVEIVAMVDC